MFNSKQKVFGIGQSVVNLITRAAKLKVIID
jgi:hypothetical protein